MYLSISLWMPNGWFRNHLVFHRERKKKNILQSSVILYWIWISKKNVETHEIIVYILFCVDPILKSRSLFSNAFIVYTLILIKPLSQRDREKYSKKRSITSLRAENAWLVIKLALKFIFDLIHLKCLGYFPLHLNRILLLKIGFILGFLISVENPQW